MIQTRSGRSVCFTRYCLVQATADRQAQELAQTQTASSAAAAAAASDLAAAREAATVQQQAAASATRRADDLAARLAAANDAVKVLPCPIVHRIGHSGGH